MSRLPYLLGISYVLRLNNRKDRTGAKDSGYLYACLRRLHRDNLAVNKRLKLVRIDPVDSGGR